MRNVTVVMAKSPYALDRDQQQLRRNPQPSQGPAGGPSQGGPGVRASLKNHEGVEGVVMACGVLE